MSIPRDPRLDDPDWLRRKYWEAGLTTGEIAADRGGGCTQAMVQKAMIRLDIPRRPPGRRPVKVGATRGASADLSSSQVRLLAEYESWLKERAYTYATVKNRVRVARRILRMYPEIPPESVTLEEAASTRRTSASRGTLRTRVRSFYEFLGQRGEI